MAEPQGSFLDQAYAQLDPLATDLQSSAAQSAGSQAGTTAAHTISGAAGGWSLSESQVHGLINRLIDVREMLKKSILDAQSMCVVRPPGEDPHSSTVAHVINESGAKYVASLRSQRAYVASLLDALRDSLKNYRGVEEENSTLSRHVDSERHGLL